MLITKIALENVLKMLAIKIVLKDILNMLTT
jgi:hypothetical protein